MTIIHGKNEYETRRKNGWVTVYLERTAPGQLTKMGSFHIKERIWQNDSMLPTFVKNEVEKAFSV